MSNASATRPQLPELSLEEWEPTKETLHLWTQIVGKIRMASTAPRNHWWHVPLYVGARGLTTRRMHAGSGIAFEIDFDFVDHRLVVATSRGGVESFELVDGLSVAKFDEVLHATLAQLGVETPIRETPFGVPATTPFPADREHASYDREAVERHWQILQWTDEVFHEFAGWYCGKTSPVHLFWHSFDLAVTRFGSKRAPAMPDANAVDRETYSHEVVSFGFWPGDRTLREPSYYAYAAPEPPGLREQRLVPEEAVWSDYGGASLALLSYEVVRGASDPTEHLLSFLESAYRAGADVLGLGPRRARVELVPEPATADRAPGEAFGEEVKTGRRERAHSTRTRPDLTALFGRDAE